MKTVQLHHLVKKLSPKDYLCNQTERLLGTPMPMHKLLEEVFPGKVYLYTPFIFALPVQDILEIPHDEPRLSKAIEARTQLIARWLAQPDRTLYIP